MLLFGHSGFKYIYIYIQSPVCGQYILKGYIYIYVVEFIIYI